MSIIRNGEFVPNLKRIILLSLKVWESMSILSRKVWECQSIPSHIIDLTTYNQTFRLTDSQTDRLTDFLTDRLTDIKTHRQIQLQTDRLIGWYIIELTNQYTNKIIDWQNYRHT